MNLPPRPRSERLLNLPLLLRTYLFLGLVEAAVAMGGFFLYLFANGWTWGTPLTWSSTLYREATTVTFAGIVLAQVANVFACRSDHLSVTKLGWLNNPLILWGIATELAILALLTYTPTGNSIFGTSPLPAWIFGPLVLGALVFFVAEEGRKMISKRLKHDSLIGLSHGAGSP
jgi:sodium/potassium-transporting ATPase subunit alpha